MSTQLPIVQYWHLAEPPDYISESTRSFAELNPDRPHLLFDAQGADDFIAEHFTARESAAFRACGPPAMQSDYFRYCAILHLGGIWVDAGVHCARNLSPLLEESQGFEFFQSYVSKHLLLNGLFAFPVPRHPFLRLAVDLSTGLIEQRWEGKVNEVTGPLVVTAIYHLHRAGSMDAYIGEMDALQQQFKGINLSEYGRTACDLIGDYGRIEEACNGVKVLPPEDRWKWVRRPVGRFPHRAQDRHWPQAGIDIYATSPRAEPLVQEWR